MLCEQIEPMVLTSDPDTINLPHGIYSEKPHVTLDNHFSGDCVIECACLKGFGVTMTVRQD